MTQDSSSNVHRLISFKNVLSVVFICESTPIQIEVYFCLAFKGFGLPWKYLYFDFLSKYLQQTNKWTFSPSLRLLQNMNYYLDSICKIWRKITEIVTTQQFWPLWRRCPESLAVAQPPWWYLSLNSFYNNQMWLKQLLKWNSKK